MSSVCVYEDFLLETECINQPLLQFGWFQFMVIRPHYILDFGLSVQIAGDADYLMSEEREGRGERRTQRLPQYLKEHIQCSKTSQ